MTEITAFLCCLWFVIAFTEVACWTVDLDEVRQFLDKQKEQEDYQQLHYHNYYDESEEYDSFADVTAHRGQNYAQQYGYEGYMEKKFENLNASLLPDVRWNETADVWNWNWAQGERKVQWSQILNITNTMTNITQNTTESPTQGATESATQRNSSGTTLTGTESQRAKCHKMTREREHVRRLADLALFTARQLQNWATNEKQYDKSSAHAKEERDLITRLAYFLDKLAELTGYTPEIKVFSKQTDKTTTTTTTTTVNPMSVPISEELRQVLLTCLRQHNASSADSAPATERCRAPQMLPPLLMRMLNITEATSAPRSSALTTTPPPPLQIDPEVRQARVLNNYLISNVWATQPTRTKRKRSLNEPLMKMVEYYTKHKVWTGANKLEIDKLIHEDLNVENHFIKPKSLEDRSDFFKRKLVFSLLHPNKNNRGLRRPKIPNFKNGYKLNKYLEKLLKSDVTSSDIVRKVNILPRKLKSLQKRSIIIEESEDPMRDISFYVKNKPGTNVRPSLADAVRVRASLQRIFNTGNIEVVRRYGANYNPLIPSPFFFGVIKTISDV
ncbi:uncharacterized protein LOC106720882 isoform X2 [Papilio machaon]|uniref:uncharacterized protein LOC106720882 isoform X2 n=1 Tax=Papilio machaon TaxID=76193 RepID=UPI001E665BA1|nr:uncharacterized protein LOC106720882 isoform X2 [Papilio machaon]